MARHASRLIGPLDELDADRADILAAGDPAAAEALVERSQEHLDDAPLVGSILTAQLVVCLAAAISCRRSVRYRAPAPS